MNSIRHISRLRLSFDKELLRPGTCVQVIPIVNYSDDNIKQSAKDDAEVPENVHPHKDKFRSSHQKANGEIYDTKPFKIRLEANKQYHWCLCGRSHSQPLCDGTHKDSYRPTPLRPIRFMVKETKEYWLCNCKHTNLRPFCDGTHKTFPPKKI